MARVLIVEDNPVNMKLALLVLETSGHQVLQATNAQDGLDAARTHLPEVILMDIQLPGMDGLSAARILKEDSHTSHIKIIALTAFAMKGDEAKMRTAGCDGYVAKPIRYKELLDAINAQL
jgi:two-component system, cell cycle response regulator DivK